METLLESIFNHIDRGYKEILSLYRGVPPAALLLPTFPNGWSVKDLLAHLAAWEWRCAGLLAEAHKSDTPLKAMPDVDALNQEIYHERQEWDWEDVDHDFREAHEALLESILTLPAERLEDGIIQRTIAEETWQHYEEHLPQLRQWHTQVTTSHGERMTT